MLLRELLASTEALRSSSSAVFAQVCEAARELCARKEALVAEADRLQADRQQLETDRALFAAECESVRQLTAQASDRIVLDVGGRHFATTRQTLCAVQGSMLAAWFSGRHTIQTREDGTVFIDRSPVLFEYVLGFLRKKGANALFPSDENLREGLKEEFMFFGLTWPEEKEPSILDWFPGATSCVLIDYQFIPRRATTAPEYYLAEDRLLMSLHRDPDADDVAILWDTNTGQRVCAFPMHDERLGKVKCANMDTSGRFVGLRFRKGNDGAVVLYNAVDGSREHTFFFKDTHIQNFIVSGTTRLIVLCRDADGDEAIVARNISTGEVMWRREFDATNRALRVLWTHSDQAFVAIGYTYGFDTHGFAMVFDMHSGVPLYEAAYRPKGLQEEVIAITGKQLTIALLRPRIGAPVGVWEVSYQSWDETGAVAVPQSLTTIEFAAENLGGDGFLSISASPIIRTFSGRDVNLYSVAVLGQSVQVKERVTWRLLGSDVGDDVVLSHVLICGGSCAALSSDGRMRVWSRRGDRGGKQHEVRA